MSAASSDQPVSAGAADACEGCTLSCGTSCATASGPTAEERVTVAAGGIGVALLAPVPLAATVARSPLQVGLVVVAVVLGLAVAGLGAVATRTGGDTAARTHARATRILPAAMGALGTSWLAAAVAVVVSLF